MSNALPPTGKRSSERSKILLRVKVGMSAELGFLTHGHIHPMLFKATLFLPGCL